MAKEVESSNLAQTVQLILEVDKLKGVLRKVRPIDEARYENTAEHSWQIALFALTLSKTLQTSLDIHRVIAMLLVHDVGEIDEGDKFVFAQDGWEAQKAAELKTVQRVFGLAATDVESQLLGWWREFDAGETPEARFARAVDRSMPVLLNLNNGGGSWLENGVTYRRVVDRVGPEIKNGCPELWTYIKQELEEAHLKGFFAKTS